LINGRSALESTAPFKYFEPLFNEGMNYRIRLIWVVFIEFVAVMSCFGIIMCDNIMSPGSQTIYQRIVTFLTTLADIKSQLILLGLV